jgi:hypothetical protein
MTSSRREAGNARQKRMHPLVLPASSSQRTLISSIMFRIKHHHGLKSSSVTTTFAASCHRLSYATSAIFIAISGPERPIGTPPDMRVRLRRWGGVEQSISQARASHQTSVPSEPGFRAFHSPWQTLQGIETMNIIHKGQSDGCRRATSRGRPRQGLPSA